MTQQSGSNERFELKRKGDILSADFINRVAAAVTRLSAVPRGADVMINSAGVFPRSSVTTKTTTTSDGGGGGAAAAINTNMGILVSDLVPATNALTDPATSSIRVLTYDTNGDLEDILATESLIIINRYTEIDTIVAGTLIMVVLHGAEWQPLSADCGITVAIKAAISGTATVSMTEANVVSGGKTIIITLYGATFKAAGTGPIGSTADTQALIDGLDSAQSEGAGWNIEVRDKEVVGAVVRTSDTVATITLTAAASYAITAEETIVTTVPTDVLVGSGSALTGTSNFTVTPD